MRATARVVHLRHRCRSIGGGGSGGQEVSAETDYKAKAEIYSYSKTKGLFAGVSLSGTKWESDYDANKEVYGR